MKTAQSTCHNWQGVSEKFQQAYKLAKKRLREFAEEDAKIKEEHGQARTTIETD